MTATMTAPTALDYTIREVVESDIPHVVNFYNTLDAAEPMNMSTTIEEWTRVWHNPADLEHSTRFLTFLRNPDGSEGQPVGYGLVYGEETAWLRMHVLPEYRNRGIGTAIYNRLAAIAGDREYRAEPNQLATLAIAFYERRGLQFDRYAWEMRLAADVAVAAPVLAEGYSVRTYVPGQDVEVYWRTVNAAFAQHHWHEDLDLAEIEYLTQDPTFSPEGIFFVTHNDEVVGLCYTAVNPGEIARRGISVGWIEDLGVLPTHQGKGLGRFLLVTGIHHLRQQVEVVELGVEGKNPTAMPLYESVGFRPYAGAVAMFRPASSPATLGGSKQG